MGLTTTAPAATRHLVAMAYPGRGHINPMLNLCKLLSSKSQNLLITLVVTEEWHAFLTAPSEPPPPTNLRFGVIPQVIPSEIGRAKDFLNFLEAIHTKLEAPFDHLLDRLHPPATAVVYDSYLFWAVAVANRRNIPVAAFSTISASMYTVMSHFDLLVANAHFPLDVSERGHDVVDYIPGLPPTAICDLPTLFHGVGRKVSVKVLESVPAILKTDYFLLASVAELESSAIDALKAKFSPSTTVLPIGPMIPYFNLESEIADSDCEYFRWLDSQPMGSVLYISMGSFLSTSDAQMDEIIAGIIESGVRYLWVTRGENNSQLKAAEMEERGRLVRWCDQLRVLSHNAVGGFWSHCGWNSTLEAAFAGVPVLTYPILWDQSLNGKMVVDEWKMGRRAGLVTRDEIAGIVREFMDAAGEGRRKMVEAAGRVSNTCKGAVAPGGSAASNLDAFVSWI